MAQYVFTGRERDLLLELLLERQDHPRPGDPDVNKLVYTVLRNAPQRRERKPPPDPMQVAIDAQRAARADWVAWQVLRHNRVVRDRQRGQQTANRSYQAARRLYARAVLREDPE